MSLTVGTSRNVGEDGIAQLLAQLRDKEVSLALKGDELAVRGETQALVPALLDSLRANKKALIELLKSGAYEAPDADGGTWVPVPPNLVPERCDTVTPDMLPLIRLTQEEIDRVVVTVPGGAGNVQDIYPLAPLQEGMLFQHLMASQGDMYLSPMLLPFDSTARVHAFVQALRAAVARHDVLRTSILWEGLPEPVQVVWREAPLFVEDVQLDPNEGDIADQLYRRFDAARYRIDLRRAPLLRLHLAHDAAGERWLLMLLFHHLAVDHAGIAILQHEVLAHLSGQAAQLPKPVPFRNFVAQARLGVPKAEHEAFFRSLLGDVDEPTAPFGLTDVQGGGASPGWARQRLGAALSARLRRAARAASVSAASLCHLAWALVIARSSGRDDVVFGTVLSARLQGGASASHVLGLFMNTLPVRVRLGGASVHDALCELHRLLAQLLRHEHASLVLAQRCSAVAAPAPLFSALLNYRQGRSAVPAQPGDSGDEREGRSNYPLSLDVDDEGDDFRLTVLAQAPADPQRVCGYMRHALEQLATALEEAPDSPLRSLDVLPAHERRQLLVEWNATQVDPPHAQCLHELFEAQAEHHPQAIALVHEDRQLTYAALNAAANRLAHHLRRIGVTADCRVALCMQRSERMVVAMLAVLKAGGGYVPLDSSLPGERLAFMLRDTDPVVLLCDGALPLELRHGPVGVLDLQSDAALWADLPGDNPSRAGAAPQPNHLAYVIYTSGSTGTPKGVMVEHRQAAHLVAALCRRYAIGPHDRVLQFASMAFDVSVEEIFCSLACGATLVLRTDAWMTGPADFWRLCHAHRITIADLPTLFWEQLAHDRHALIPTTLRRIIIGGEAVGDDALASWFSRDGHRPELSNAYGPTETTVNATIAELSTDRSQWKSIGRPIANTRVYLLDARGQPVPIGVAGELAIGGAGVARGYLNQPALTAERFVADPFSGEPQARLYKTGDLARYRPDGAIEFAGRNDFQMKIRGFRIEPGEIEARLREWPGLREAVVLAFEDKAGDKRLVAYCVSEGALDAEALQAHLAATLPAVMVPGAFVRLDALPLTAGGKLDRRALPAPQAQRSAGVYEAPQGEVETRLAAIWAEVLQLPRVGRHDDFFALGGHSLSAIRLTERMRQAGLAVDVRTLFTTPRLSVLAAQAGRARGGVTVPPNAIPSGCEAITPAMLPLVQLDQAQIDGIVVTVPGGAANVQDIYPLAPMQQGILFHHLMPHPGDVYLETMLFGVPVRADVERLRAALQVVIDRHDILRTAFAWEGLPEPLQVVWRAAPLLTQELQLDPVDGEIAAQLQARFDPRRHRIEVRRAPLLQLHAAHDPSKGHWVLLLAFHHLVADHTTTDLMREEMGLVLRGESARLPAPLPFRNFVAQARLGVPEKEHEAFFSEMLGDVDEPTLPFGLSDVHGDGSNVSEARRKLDGVLAARLRERAKVLGVSPASLCHLAWALVLSRTSGRHDVVFGTVLFGRMQGGEGADRALGLFINTLPMRVRLGEASVLDGVRQVHATLARLMHHEHASLALAQRCSAVPAPSPLFSALMNYRYASGERQEAPDSFEEAAPAATQERSNYPVSLDVDDFGVGFGLTAQVQAPHDPQRLCDFMQQALDGIVSALESTPQALLHSLDMLPAAERRRVLVEWNATDAPFPRERCIHELFEAQAARVPEAIAVLHDGHAISYGELNARANRLARHLRDRGVAPDARVALCVQRNPDMLVALLAVLKAGGAYLPLDPGYPIEQLAAMIDDSTPAALLMDGAVSAAVQSRLNEAMAHVGAPVVRLQLDAACWASHDDGNLLPAGIGLRPDHLAYVMYTSGSTGRPKGVMIEHRGVCNYITALRQRCEVGSGDRVLQFSSINFDASTEEILLALFSGAALVLRDDEWLADARSFWHRCERSGVTIADLPTRFWQQMTQDPALAIPASLRLIIIAGEAADAGALVGWFARAGHRPRLLNAYGPTETTMIATIDEPSSGDDARCIGRPLANNRAYVLDGHRQPVPIGVAGELCVSGVQVARGYLNRPELTAERFVADPFHGGRMYRTGDLVRQRPDGRIEFLGRNDQQVKIRGFRIELGEIEARLLQQPGITGAAVLAREDHPGDKRLVAYCTADAAIDTHALRAELAKLLPEVMLPAAVVQLDRLPLSPAGKLDRKALPAPDEHAHAHADYEAPLGETEIQLARIWAELLKLERVGRHDDFFALGGHSLLAIRLLESMRQHGLSADVRSLFTASTLAAFAAATEDMEIKI